MTTIRGIQISGCATALVFFLYFRIADSQPEHSSAGQGTSKTGKETSTLSVERPRIDPEILKRQEALAYASEQSTSHVPSLLDDDGELDFEKLRPLGVSDAQALEIKSAYQTARREMADDFKKRIESDPRRSDPARSTQAFKVKSAPESGDEISSRMRSQIIKAVGQDLSDTVYRGLLPCEQFGNFGRQEIHFNMTPSDTSEIGYEIQVNFYEPQFMVSLGQRRIRSQKDLSLVLGSVLNE